MSTVLLWTVPLLLLVVACGTTATATSVPTPTTIPTPSPTPLLVSVGHELFVTKGCAACHGRNAEGSKVAPALGGHSGSQVIRQARAPVGIMPVFPPDKVSNETLGQIAEFVESLSGEHAHMVAGGVKEALTEHHWMAFFSIEDGNQSEAIHHIDHIIELVTGDHLARMQQTRQMVEQGNLHEAGHIVKDMLSGTPSLELSSEEMHLRLALSSTRIEEAAEAAHHLEHYLAVASPDSEGAASAAEVMELLEAGDLADAEHELTELTGAAHEEGEAHEEGDEHTEGAEHEEGDEHTEGAEHEEGEAHVEGDEHGEK